MGAWWGSAAVRITHEPTGATVTVNDGRSPPSLHRMLRGKLWTMKGDQRPQPVVRTYSMPEDAHELDTGRHIDETARSKGETMTNAIDTSRIMEQIRENQRRLDGCRRHSFPAVPIVSADRAAFRHRYRCQHCGGEVDAVSIMNYCAGYVAAGGDSADVWSPYAEHVAKFREALQG